MASSVIRRAVYKIASRNGSSNFRRHLSSVNVIGCPFPDIDLQQASIPDFVFEKIEPYSDKIAFECGVTGRSYTYDDIKIKSRNFSRLLRKKLNLQQDEIVAVMLPNVPEFPIVVLGTLLAGLRVTTLNPIYTPDEIKRQLDDSGAKIIITMTELHASVTKALGDKKMPIISISDQPTSDTPLGAINFREFIDTVVDMKDLSTSDPHSVAIMPYSSGTTGLPKGVLLTHQNIVSNLQQFSSPNFHIMEHATATFQDVVPAVLPMFHIYGFTAICFASLMAGSKVITIPKFTPDLYLKTLKVHKPTVLMVVPPIVIFLNAHPAVTKEILKPVRVLMSGAAPLGALDEQKFKEKIDRPMNVLQGYGLSETSPVITMVSHTYGSKPGSTGCVIPNTKVKIIPIDDSASEPLGPNKTGELFVKGPQVMLGYHNRPEETADTLLPDGWLRTGDMFYYDDSHTFYITDRIKELIKVKGFQVPPAELEEILRDYPGVSDAAVIGIPHEKHGEVPRAYVVAKPNTKLDTAKLDEFVGDKVAEYKRIRGGIVVVDAIPKNASGKILRRQLKLQYEKEQK